MKNIIVMNHFYYENLFDDLNIIIPRNKFITISGPNNCGKTTLIRILNREIITENIIMMDKKDINDYLIDEYSKIIQCVIPNEIIWEHSNLKEELYSIKEDKEEINLILKNLKIVRIASKNNKEYTIKETIRAQLALALIQEPKILLLDSIGNFFSEEEMIEMIRYLKEYQRNRDITIISTTIHLKESLYSDYLYVIANQKIALEGKPTEVLEKDNLLNKIGLKIPFMIDLSVKLRDYDLIDHIEQDKNRMIEELWK